MEAVGQLTTGISHDINNILAIIQGNLELIHGSCEEPDERRGFARMALEATGRAATLTHRLLAFSRKQPLEPRATDLNSEVANIIDLLRPTLGETIDLEINLAAGLRPALVGPSQFENAVVNLAVNARDAMPSGGRLRIKTENAVLDADHGPDVVAGPYALLSVSDTGTGMPADVVERAFDPFFSTKVAGRGSGLGLSMVCGFIKQSGGHVEIESRPGKGTRIRLYLPIAHTDAAASETSHTQEDMPRGGGETILVVEDDPAVRVVVTRSLEDLGYATIEAADGEAALAMLRKRSGVSAILTDLVLPGGLGGADIARLARLDHPGLGVFFMPGHGQVEHDGNGAPPHLVVKPFRITELARKLRTVLDGG
jgi:CheY-like chemotaxis protein